MTESKFYIVNAVKDTQKKIQGKVKTYNKKYVKKHLKNGKEFITELKADPIKRIDDLISDSKDAVKKTRDERYNVWKKAVIRARKDMKVRFEKLNTDTKNRFEKVNIEGKKVYKGVEKDVNLIIKDVIEVSKKNIEKRISKGIDAIPSKLKLNNRYPE
jgi:hypothetical protein